MTPLATDPVRVGLERAAAELRERGLPTPALEGKALRPLAAYTALPPSARPGPDDAFWFGALALEMVHEASLLHDDILDGAACRRGSPTVAALHGHARALVQGDHLLTASYVAAGESGQPAFIRAFIAAVERTVAGEIRQGSAAGRPLEPHEYRAVIEGKSGELFGAALALAAAFTGDDVDGAAARGRRMGALYQMVDDFLDYCPRAALGKPAFQDLRQGKWTFVLEGSGLDMDPGARERLEPEALAGTLFRGGPGGSVMRAALRRLEDEAAALRGEAQLGELHDLVEGWLALARTALAAEEARLAPATVPRQVPSPEAWVAMRAARVGGAEAWPAYFARHSRSFRFASWLFPRAMRRQVEGVYAFCRFTDDLVDEAEGDAATARTRLEAWGTLVSAAHEGVETGIPLADRVMGSMRDAGVPFGYARDLLAGVAMDLEPVRLAGVADLQLYTYRVASVVGGWITELFGVHDAEILARAYGLGHAMQLTNIVRDVGEDWRRDRLYLPEDLRQRYGVDLHMVDAVARGSTPVPEAWTALLEDLMARADRGYDEAFQALPSLPGSFARPVAVAARVYQGIHGTVRSNGYDNGTRRAHTSGLSKLRLGARGLLHLRRARHAANPALVWTALAQRG